MSAPVTELGPSDVLWGTWASVLLPITPVGGIDARRLDDELDALLSSGVHGLYTNGTAGEFYAQDFEEYCWLSEKLAAACRRAKVPMQIGASFPTAQEARRRASFAATLDPAAIQVTLPDWTALSEPETVRFLVGIADVTGELPLIIYNPPHAKTVLDPDVLARVHGAVPTVVGAKVAWDDPSWLPRMLELVPDFRVFVPGHLLATERRRGASGSYSNAACLNPRAAETWWRRMHDDSDAAVDLQRRLVGFMERHIVPLRDQQGYSNQALDKLLAAIGGWADIGTDLRWPYLGVSSTHVNPLREIAQEELPEYFVVL